MSAAWASDDDSRHGDERFEDEYPIQGEQTPASMMLEMYPLWPSTWVQGTAASVSKSSLAKKKRFQNQLFLVAAQTATTLLCSQPPS